MYFTSQIFTLDSAVIETRIMVRFNAYDQAFYESVFSTLPSFILRNLTVCTVDSQSRPSFQDLEVKLLKNVCGSANTLLNFK